jgi:metal-responsive CopG/Arc/MetJ family transcriptional regulator
MSKSATPHRKTRGRHRTSRDAVTAVRLPGEILGRIDRWRREHGTKTRAQAIQRLVEQALGTDPARRTTRKAAAKASELAGREIDRLADPSVAAEEQAKRKRRLIKGPREFRPVRRDPASD